VLVEYMIPLKHTATTRGEHVSLTLMSKGEKRSSLDQMLQLEVQID
jgi:hypothetical protein